MSKANFLRPAGVAAALLLLFFGLAPLPFGVVHTGIFVLSGAGAALLAVCLLWDRFDGGPYKIHRRLYPLSDPRRPSHTPRWWRRLRALLCLMLAALACFGGVASAFMVRAAWFSPPAPGATVVVLGCQVLGDRPSTMLAYRLQAAQSWLTAHPQSAVVCSGGLNDGGPYSEAAVMQQWLVAHGIDEDRIYLEDRSANTRQNIAFTAQVIAENGLSPSLAVASDGFHQLRAEVYAAHEQLPAGALPAKTPWGLAPSYWVREWFGLVKAFLETSAGRMLGACCFGFPTKTTGERVPPYGGRGCGESAPARRVPFRMHEKVPKVHLRGKPLKNPRAPRRSAHAQG